jgi:hypothetical protein
MKKPRKARASGAFFYPNMAQCGKAALIADHGTRLKF